MVIRCKCWTNRKNNGLCSRINLLQDMQQKRWLLFDLVRKCWGESLSKQSRGSLSRPKNNEAAATDILRGVAVLPSSTNTATPQTDSIVLSSSRGWLQRKHRCAGHPIIKIRLTTRIIVDRSLGASSFISPTPPPMGHPCHITFILFLPTP